MNLFENETYKQCLRGLMLERRQQFGSRFTFEKMAAACGIQKTYLSKVLNTSVHLNPDQLFTACEYLKLNATETEFVLLMRECEVATNSKRANLLKAKIKKIRSDVLKTESAISVKNESSVDSRKWEYYTDVDLQLVHMFLTIPSYAKNPNQICQHIGIDSLRLQAILIKLQDWLIIRYEEGLYQVSDPKLHLPEDSPVFMAFGILQRIKTLEKLRRSKNEKSDDYFFSVVFSASTKLQSTFKRKILDVLKELQASVIESKSEELYQLNIDFFKWT